MKECDTKSLIFSALLLISNAGQAQGLNCYGAVDVYQSDPYVLTVEWKDAYAEHKFLEELSSDGFLTPFSHTVSAPFSIYTLSVDVARAPGGEGQDSTQAVDRSVESVIQRLAKKYQHSIHLSCNIIVGAQPRGGGMN